MKNYIAKPIPLNLRDKLSADPFYSTCCLRDNECAGRIEFHHAFMYGGKRQNVKFAILPCCHHHHSIEKRKDIKAKLNKIMVARMTADDFKKFPRFKI